jgi:hypothetical protein
MSQLSVCSAYRKARLARVLQVRVQNKRGERVSVIHDVKLKQEVYAVAHAVLGFLMVGLVIIGIGGTIYKVISPDGWIALAFGRSLSAGAASLGSLVMITALAWFSRGWTTPTYRNRFSELLVYTFAAAGFIYLAQLLVKGSF